MLINVGRPPRLYRYSKQRYLLDSLRLGHFRLNPATDYKSMSGDSARQDDEQLRRREVEGGGVSIVNMTTGEPIRPIGQVRFDTQIQTNYYVLCFSKSCDIHMYELFKGTDACLVVHEPDVFCERIHSAVSEVLPAWVGMDAETKYGARNPLGAVFEKDARYFAQSEWRFAWLPPQAKIGLSSVDIKIGSIEGIAEVVSRPS